MLTNTPRTQNKPVIHSHTDIGYLTDGKSFSPREMDTSKEVQRTLRNKDIRLIRQKRDILHKIHLDRHRQYIHTSSDNNRRTDVMMNERKRSLDERDRSYRSGKTQEVRLHHTICRLVKDSKLMRLGEAVSEGYEKEEKEQTNHRNYIVRKIKEAKRIQEAEQNKLLQTQKLKSNIDSMYNHITIQTQPDLLKHRNGLSTVRKVSNHDDLQSKKPMKLNKDNENRPNVRWDNRVGCVVKYRYVPVLIEYK